MLNETAGQTVGKTRKFRCAPLVVLVNFILHLFFGRGAMHVAAQRSMDYLVDRLAENQQHGTHLRRRVNFHFHSMHIVPATMSVPPMTACHEMVSPKMTNAKTIVRAMLNLSMGATRDTSPS